MQRSTFWRGAAVLALAALAACDAPITTTPKQETDDLARQVEALGFRSDGMVDFGRYVVVEGDIRLEKSRLPSVASSGRGGPAGPRFQYRTTGLVGSPRVHQITVDLAGLAAEPAWQDAVRAALPLWSGIAGSYVRMVEAAPGAPGDIDFVLGCLQWNWVAVATWPIDGLPGLTVAVNNAGCLGLAQNDQQRLHNMVHELGHTLGFRHSNYQQLGEGAGIEGAIHVTGTPTSGNDAGSVMNGGTALNAWAGFSAADLNAARWVYPLPQPVPTVSNSGGTPLVSWGALVGATSYTVRFIHHIAVRSRVEESWTDEEVVVVGTTTGTSLLDPGRTWTGDSSCHAEFPNYTTRVDTYRYEVVATFPTGTASRYVSAPVGDC